MVFFDPWSPIRISPLPTPWPSTLVAYLRHTGPTAKPSPDFWRDQFVPGLHAPSIAAVRQIRHRPRQPALDRPAHAATTPAWPCRQAYGAAGGHADHDTSCGLYVVYDFRGGVPEIAQAWTALFAEWLPASGWGVDLPPAPCFQFYRKTRSSTRLPGIRAAKIRPGGATV